MTGSYETPSSGNDRSYGGAERDLDEDETEIIAADIRITQERLGDTVEEIGERFNPTRLKEELKSDIRDATIGKVENMAQQTADMVSDAQRSIMQSIRENPVPAVMVGIGLGWMILNASAL
jgi:phosphate uptake regulator